MNSTAATEAAYVGSTLGSSFLSIAVVGGQLCGIDANTRFRMGRVMGCLTWTNCSFSTRWTFTGPLRHGGFGMGSRSMHGPLARARDRSCVFFPLRLEALLDCTLITAVPGAIRLAAETRQQT